MVNQQRALINQQRAQVNRQRVQVNRQRAQVNRQRVQVSRQRAQNWRTYRQTHRSVFHRPAFVAPRGYRYRRVTVGYRLAPIFWTRAYWIDYGLYLLPPPPPGTIYVRYWNDVLLVSRRTGRVLAVYHDFFW